MKHEKESTELAKVLEFKIERTQKKEASESFAMLVQRNKQAQEKLKEERLKDNLRIIRTHQLKK